MLETRRRGKAAKVTACDPVWDRVRQDAEAAARAEPELAALMFANILNHSKLEHAVCHRLAQRLDHDNVNADLIRQTFLAIADREPEYGAVIRADSVGSV